MNEKPAEISNYPGQAYEIIYWENKRATSERAFDQWRETSVARALITNFKEWESFEWKALGVALHEGFAIAWFGLEEDVEPETIICESGKRIKNKSSDKPQKENEIVESPMNRYYIIFGSFSSLEDAEVQLKKYREEGFKKAKIIVKDDKFRISLSDYPDNELASEAKNELPVKYKNAWILAY